MSTRDYPFGRPISELARDELPPEIAAAEQARDDAQLEQLERWLVALWQRRSSGDDEG